MKVLLVGPFERANERGMFSELADGCRTVDVREGLVYDRHQSSLMALTVPAESEVIDADGRAVSLWRGASDISFVVVEVDVPDRASLHELEPQLEQSINRALACRFGEAAVQKSGYHAHRVLWWHRVLLNADDDLPRAVRHYGKRVPTDSDADCVVANGFSVLRGGDAAAREEFLGGLMAATEDWIIVDSLSRRLRNALLDARTAAGSHLENVVRSAEQTAYLTALALLLMDERRRNLANLVQGVHGAASRSWGLKDDLAALREHAAAVASLVTGFYETRSDRADERRNTILFGFTVVTVLQSLLMIVEFGAGSSLELVSLGRVVLSGMVLVATLAIILRYVVANRDPGQPS